MAIVIQDPVTGTRLDIMGEEESGEVYPANVDKVVASIRRVYVCDTEEAIRKLAHSDIENPVMVGSERFWAE